MNHFKGGAACYRGRESRPTAPPNLEETMKFSDFAEWCGALIEERREQLNQPIYVKLADGVLEEVKSLKYDYSVDAFVIDIDM